VVGKGFGVRWVCSQLNVLRVTSLLGWEGRCKGEDSEQALMMT
jgi:hypothetical protein